LPKLHLARRPGLSRVRPAFIRQMKCALFVRRLSLGRVCRRRHSIATRFQRRLMSEYPSIHA
jgi:hypothetical protein